MRLEISPPLLAPVRRRSIFVTVLGWALVILGGLVSPVSAISLLMLIAGSHGTASADFAGIMSVVVAPPFAVVTGVGLLRRWRWAWLAALGLFAGVIAFNVRELATARSTTTTTTTSTGVKTTVMASGPNYHSLPLIALSLVVIGKLLTRSIRAELGGSDGQRIGSVETPSAPSSAPAGFPAGRDWRVGHSGRDRMFYEEVHAGSARRLELEGEMLTGRAHHVIYFDSPRRWQRYPEWARHRREEIIARIQSEFRAPDYEYQEVNAGDETASSPRLAPTVAAVATRAKTPATSQQRATAWLVVALLFGFAATMGWLVQRGLNQSVTTLPISRASLQRPLARATEPVAYWAALGVYSVLGMGAAGAGFWLLRETRRAGAS